MIKLTRNQVTLLLKHAPTIGVSNIASQHYSYPTEDTSGRSFVWHYKSNNIVLLLDASLTTTVTTSDDDLLAIVLLPTEEARDAYFTYLLRST